MASATSSGVPKTDSVTHEERRWVVVGICLTKVFTPALRTVLANEIPKWHQTLIMPPHHIDKQTFRKHFASIPPSTLKLNYESINNNSALKSSKKYDYTVKDPMSLAKLLMKPYMASFTGFDQTMDTSAVLSVVCEAQPFITSGAAVIARKVRSDIRNEWAHCNFAHWTDAEYQNALQTMESLIKKLNLKPAEENALVDELKSWKDKGLKLCFGQAVDPELLKVINSGISELQNSVQLWKEESQCQELVLKNLVTINSGLQQEVEILKERLTLYDQRSLSWYKSTSRNIEILRNQVNGSSFLGDEDTANVFGAPNSNPWFSGRKTQLQKLGRLLADEEHANQHKISHAAVCGLGGSGKTSLVAEYAQQKKDHYQGGVFWLSGEDDKKLENSVNEVAFLIGTFVPDSFDGTLSKTLARISRIRKPWLIVLDDMDDLHISQNVLKLVCGGWQHGATGDLVVTTRRKPSVLIDDIRCFQDNWCIQLECFNPEEAKTFLFNRTGIPHDKETDAVAGSLVAELGGLPLALEQAGAYIKSLDCTLSSYLDTYKTKCLQLLNKEKKVARVSEYESSERLAVQTTWLLNFEYIKQNTEGGNAIRFLNASAFLDADEIQEELINVGKPFVEDEGFREFVGTGLGSKQVLKMLTDFSLFKQFREGNSLSVHRLVQEVVRENLSPDEKADSLVDAVRMLRYAFSKCPSPDDLLSSVAVQQQRNVSVDLTNVSLFYRWSKFCLHCHDIYRHVETLVRKSPRQGGRTMFFPETARVVYECALHLNVNCRSEEAKQAVDFAYRILDWARCNVEPALVKDLFPHIFPLPEDVRRHIQYSCKAPVVCDNTDSTAIENDQPSSDPNQSDELEEMRFKGNRLFREGAFDEAVEVYSHAITIAKGKGSLDPRFLSNRSSAFLKLQQCENALKDSEEYISLCPECWKGYARKALALEGLDKRMEAKCFAAVAFYYKRSIFLEYNPFKTVFGGLEKSIEICASSYQLLAALPTVSLAKLLFPVCEQRIILLKPGEYVINLNDIAKLEWCEKDILCVGHCILWGVKNKALSSLKVTLKFKGGSCLKLEGTCYIANIDFNFEEGTCVSGFPSSVITLSHCSFTSANQSRPAVQALVRLNVESCSFLNCKAGGLLVGSRSGIADVRNSVCSGNGTAGLEVREQGSLVVTGCDLFGNLQGLLIGPAASKCTLTHSTVRDNKVEGVMVMGTSTGVVLSSNSVFQNDHYGVSVVDSSALIESCKVFDNGLLGIWVEANSLCRISRNKVYRNKSGGIRVGMRDEHEAEESVIEFNTIFNNGGPGIVENRHLFEETPIHSHVHSRISRGSLDLLSPTHCGKKAKRVRNELINNKEKAGSKPPPPASSLKLCSYCQKEASLNKCGGCFVVEYCSRNCQKRHWKAHRNVCSFYLRQFSIEVNPSLLGLERISEAESQTAINNHLPGLDPIGPKHCKPPQQDGGRFIVKVQTAYILHDVFFTHSKLFIYDRSTTVYGYCESPFLINVVREYGELCQREYIEKKLFMWALFCKNGKLRILTNEFPPSQGW